MIWHVRKPGQMIVSYDEVKPFYLDPPGELWEKTKILSSLGSAGLLFAIISLG